MIYFNKIFNPNCPITIEDIKNIEISKFENT